MIQVSLVMPVYNERDNLAPLLGEVEATLAGIEYEVIAVDDGSTDGSLSELQRLQASHRFLRVLELSPHAGQSAAFTAGIECARGNIVVVGYRIIRSDSRWKSLQSRVANSIRNWLTGDQIRDVGCSLKAMRRDSLLRLPKFDGMHRFYPTLIRLAGGLVAEAPVSHRPRITGKSKYGMWNRAGGALGDAIGVRWLGRRVLRYTTKEEAK
jgi:glycosyltransferase involved in cell wall biosynthesis